jgi:hypothetical protein
MGSRASDAVSPHHHDAGRDRIQLDPPELVRVPAGAARHVGLDPDRLDLGGLRVLGPGGRDLAQVEQAVVAAHEHRVVQMEARGLAVEQQVVTQGKAGEG